MLWMLLTGRRERLIEEKTSFVDIRISEADVSVLRWKEHGKRDAKGVAVGLPVIWFLSRPVPGIWFLINGK